MNSDELRERLQWLRGEDGVATAVQTVETLAGILAPLFAAEGMELVVPRRPQDTPIDLAAKNSDQQQPHLSVAIEYRHSRASGPLGIDRVHRLLGAISSGPFNRALLISRSGFTEDAKQAAADAAITLELLDLDVMDAWIERVERGEPKSAVRIQLLIRSIGHEFAKMVASHPDALERLEWFDLERMMHRVMQGLGFEATLTPPSKDGGKDLILKCRVRDEIQSFIVELKHWRSGKRVGSRSVAAFLKVLVSENREGGLFLSTSGYASDALEGLTEVSRERLRIGGRTKIILLAQQYVRASSGLWIPPSELPEVLFDQVQNPS